MSRLVQCVKLGRELPGLEKPPFPGSLGARIFENVSQDAWEMWREHQTILINHYALNPADPDDRKLLRQQMEEYFFGEGARMPEGWTPSGTAGSGGSDKGGGAPAKGGGGAAPRKK